jgi:hypothetical protein
MMAAFSSTENKLYQGSAESEEAATYLNRHLELVS